MLCQFTLCLKDNHTIFVFQGCLLKLRTWFARNYLSTGAGVVTMFIIQVQYIQLSYFSHYKAYEDNPTHMVKTLRHVSPHTTYQLMMSKQVMSNSYHTREDLM